jgi:hypothetical protein
MPPDKEIEVVAEMREIGKNNIKPSLKDMNTHKSTCYLIAPLLVEGLQV